MKKIILLDRNVYIEIEKKLACRKYNKLRIRNLKKRYDQYETFILPLSIIEGEKSAVETSGEKYNTFQKETSVLEKFFKKARNFPLPKLTNPDIDQEFREILKDIFPDQTQDFENVKIFLKKVNEILHNDISQQNYEKYEKKIIDIAIDKQLALYNPIILCTIFVLHKNQQIRNIYKFGTNYEQKIYNVLSDFNVLKQQAMIKKNFKDRGKQVKVEIVTFDNSLKYLNENLNIELIEDSSDGLEYKIIFPFKLLKDSVQNQSDEENLKIQKRVENYYKEKIK